MKLTNITYSLIAATALLSAATASPAEAKTKDKDQDGLFITKCYKRHKEHPMFNPEAFEANVQTWKKEFGSGGGELVHGLGGDRRYQAVCCSGWCLYVNIFNFNDLSWTDDAFDKAAERLRRKYSTMRRVKGHCHTTMTVKRPDLEMGFISEPDKIWFSTGHEPGMTKVQHPFDVWGDTCGGDPGFIQHTEH